MLPATLPWQGSRPTKPSRQLYSTPRNTQNLPAGRSHAGAHHKIVEGQPATPASRAGLPRPPPRCKINRHCPSAAHQKNHSLAVSHGLCPVMRAAPRPSRRWPALPYAPAGASEAPARAARPGASLAPTARRARRQGYQGQGGSPQRRPAPGAPAGGAAARGHAARRPTSHSLHAAVLVGAAKRRGPRQRVDWRRGGRVRGVRLRLRAHVLVLQTRQKVRPPHAGRATRLATLRRDAWHAGWGKDACFSHLWASMH